jgi:hypothetical protein
MSAIALLSCFPLLYQIGAWNFLAMISVTFTRLYVQYNYYLSRPLPHLFLCWFRDTLCHVID